MGAVLSRLAIGLLLAFTLSAFLPASAGAEDGRACNPSIRDNNAACTPGAKCRRTSGQCGMWQSICIDDPSGSRASTSANFFLCDALCTGERGECETRVVRCNTDANCLQGELCLLGVCTFNGCRGNDDCRADERCTQSQCVPAPQAGANRCTVSSQCGSGRACRGGFCRQRSPPPACARRSQCAEDEFCIDGRCVAH